MENFILMSILMNNLILKKNEKKNRLSKIIQNMEKPLIIKKFLFYLSKVITATFVYHKSNKNK